MVVCLVPDVWRLVAGDFAFCGYLAWCLLYLVCFAVGLGGLVFACAFVASLICSVT